MGLISRSGENTVAIPVGCSVSTPYLRLSSLRTSLANGSFQVSLRSQTFTCVGSRRPAAPIDETTGRPRTTHACSRCSFTFTLSMQSST